MGRKRQHSPWWSKEAAPLTDVNQRAEERDFPAAQDTAQSPSPQPQNKKVVLPQNCLPWVRLSTALSTVIIRRHTHQRSLSLLPPTHSPCCHHSPPHAPGSRRRVRILCWCHLQRQGKTVSIRQGGGSAAKNCLPVTSTIAHSPYHHFPPSLCRSHILHGWLREEDIGASVSIRQGGEVLPQNLSVYHTCHCLLTLSSPLPPSLLSLVPLPLFYLPLHAPGSRRRV